MQSIKSINKDLGNLLPSDYWDDVEKYYPKYSQSTTVQISNDYDKVLSNEIDISNESDFEMLKNIIECFNTRDELEYELRMTNLRLYIKALQTRISDLSEHVNKLALNETER